MSATSPPSPGAVEAALPRLDDSFARELPELCAEWEPVTVPDPELVTLDDDLARSLSLDPEALASAEGVEILAGNRVPDGPPPVAMGYAGHQFGSYSPRLGDGRALLLGELVAPDGRRVDVHLKGSGRTPFARGGDGKATIGPMLREVVISEALHVLGVPTTRSLAVVTTGELVQRNRMEPGAVLTRVAASHIRVGTFEYAARLGVDDLVARLAKHAIERHHPEAADADEPHRAFLAATVEAQAELVAKWMLLGFIHGVMNTDNMTVSGEGIDYGPCAFMDHFDPATVFSSIDHGGRYAYGNQPAIATWNLARLAETLLPLISDDHDESVEIATEIVTSFGERLDAHWRAGMQHKLGLAEPPADAELFDDLLRTMHADRLDVTSTFRALAADLRGDDLPDGEALASWSSRWHDALDHEGRDRADVATAIDRVNPVYVPRNHIVEEALEAATVGDLAPFHQLLEVVRSPFDEHDDRARYAEPAPPEFTEGYQTFCGT